MWDLNWKVREGALTLCPSLQSLSRCAPQICNLHGKKSFHWCKWELPSYANSRLGALTQIKTAAGTKGWSPPDPLQVPKSDTCYLFFLKPFKQLFIWPSIWLLHFSVPQPPKWSEPWSLHSEPHHSAGILWEERLVCAYTHTQMLSPSACCLLLLPCLRLSKWVERGFSSPVQVEPWNYKDPAICCALR